MIVYLTGASGFIGSHLLGALQAREHEVVPVVRQARHQPQLTRQIDASSMTAATLAGPGERVMVHCAGRAHVTKETAQDPLEAFRQSNVRYTLKLAQLAAESGIRRFVFLSSIKVNGEATVPGRPFTAFDEPQPLNPYGISKLEAEQALRQLGAATGMEIVIIRPVLVYGPGAKANIRSLVRCIERGIPLPLGSVRNQRSLLALDNLVDLISICLDHPAAAGQVFLAADGHDVSTPDLVRCIAQEIGSKARLLSMPVPWLQAAGRLIGKGDAVQRLCGSLQADIHHTCKTLSWNPPLSFEQGLRRMIGGQQ